MDDEWCLEFESAAAKAGKDQLKHLGWLDSKRKSHRINGGARIAFPITSEAAQLLNTSGGLETLGAGGTLVHLPDCGRAGSSSPQQKLQQQLCSLLVEKSLPLSLAKQIPTRWEKLGDLALLPATSLRDEAWGSLGSSLWETIAQCINVSRLARQAPIAATGTRDSRVELLLGEDGLVKHRENGIIYSLDVTKCMFSSGNVTERSRMGNLNCEGEVVVDLFAGIGYFVLPFLLRARARHVYACEWNPNALAALRMNLELKSVDEQRFTVLEGDNRVMDPEGVCDRVCLGLLPSSEGSWGVALKALKAAGGVLHVHENVKDSEEEKWVEYLLSSLQTLAKSQGRLNWRLSVGHVEHVKWYAPHIRHIVVDIIVETNSMRNTIT